jgi:hypothetical protein
MADNALCRGVVADEAHCAHIVNRCVFGALPRCGAFVLLLSACANFTSTEYDTTDTEALRYAQSGDLRAEVDSVVQPLVARGDTPGVEVGILLPDGTMRFFGYGVASATAWPTAIPAVRQMPIRCSPSAR